MSTPPTLQPEYRDLYLSLFVWVGLVAVSIHIVFQKFHALASFFIYLNKIMKNLPIFIFLLYNIHNKLDTRQI